VNMYQRLYPKRSYNIQTVRTFGKRSIRIPREFLGGIDGDIRGATFKKKAAACLPFSWRCPEELVFFLFFISA
jgi:hypothetical protein